MELQSSVLVNGRDQSLDPGGIDEGKEEHMNEEQPDEGKCTLLGTQDNGQCHGLYDRPLGCFGCGVGWFCFILGFVFPLLWYIATALYFGEYYHKDPRERAGLAASAIAALICAVVALITLIVLYL